MSRAEIFAQITDRLDAIAPNSDLNGRRQSVVAWEAKSVAFFKAGNEDRQTRWISTFSEKLEGVSATVHHILDLGALPQLVATILRCQNRELKACAVDRLVHLSWKNAGLEVRCGEIKDTDEVCLTVADAGIAETGTLLVTSGQDQGTSHSLLPTLNIAVVNSSDIVATYEQAWERLMASRDQEIPRAVNFITGPSRTGDIEQRILLGAHGPLALDVVIVGSTNS